MVDLAQHFDEYGRKARLYPALLVSFPGVVLFALVWPGVSLEALLPIAAAAGLPFFLGNFVRDRGQLLQKRLIKHWGGLPTTRMLRLGEPDNNPDQLRQRRDGLERLTGTTLPTVDEERLHPRRSDERYICATRELITHVRRNEEKHPLVKIELTNYGFGRNLLALKPIAITLLIALLVVDFAVGATTGEFAKPATTAAIHTVILLGWLTIVRPNWVLRQGNNYAERLFETLLTPPSDTTSAR